MMEKQSSKRFIGWQKR